MSNEKEVQPIRCNRRPFACCYRDANQCGHDRATSADSPKTCDCPCHQPLAELLDQVEARLKSWNDHYDGFPASWNQVDALVRALRQRLERERGALSALRFALPNNPLTPLDELATLALRELDKHEKCEPGLRELREQVRQLEAEREYGSKQEFELARQLANAGLQVNSLERQLSEAKAEIQRLQKFELAWTEGDR